MEAELLLQDLCEVLYSDTVIDQAQVQTKDTLRKKLFFITSNRSHGITRLLASCKDS